MSCAKERKLIKIALIVMPVGLLIGMIIDEIPHLPEHETQNVDDNVDVIPLYEGVSDDLDLDSVVDKTSDGTELESGFGKITISEKNHPQNTDSELKYSNDALGFEITLPNHQWSINQDVADLANGDKEFLDSKGFVGGIYVQKDDGTDMLVAVIDISKQDVMLSEYVDTQIGQLKERFESTLYVYEVSPENNWALFGIAVETPNDTSYGEQLLQIQNNTLYMIQYSGLPPNALDGNSLEQVRMILDSFRIL
ncbi:MAG: hypothetical protein DWQ18_03460 [Crenarchaeota archaeon]|nr:MAG: hypothetical protein DWQ17_09670 [Thermoproteota archaeon]RDJ33972.1 MAG: hypothetical protein DWQ18_03460 [Thermoproteota archaeon]RDJ36913.1 MAG: hypothetical protein DWQ13_07155 [Thermoproteota archaeon]RDJ37552.1 MAG: hypothetical protein DWQ19_03680 [Thermoproteota archaeon]